MGVLLYVEDHRPAQMLMQAIIGEMTPHRLVVAGSGEEARALVGTLRPDLYIIDMDLPDTDGVALAHVLKAAHPAPVLLVSAYAESIKEATIKTVASAYLAKPLDPTDVARVIERPWPDQGDLPDVVRQQALGRIRRYWRGRIWLQIVLGEAVLWIAAETQHIAYAHSYAVPLLLATVVYFLGILAQSGMLWLNGMVVLFAIHGMLIKGLGGVTAVSLMLPYTFGTMTLAGRRRVIVQVVCVTGFWFSLLFEFAHSERHFNRLDPPPYLSISYSILIAAATFQGLRFLNRLAIELNTIHVADEVTQRSQQFLARVSHELRTPLNSVLGFAKMLRRTDLQPTQAEYLTQIVEEGEQLNYLVSDLLDSAQLSAGRLILHIETCNVNAISQAVAEEVQSLLRPGVTLKTALSPELPEIQADGMRLRQVVRNLVGNAAKYTVQGEIVLRTALRGSSILIAVSDTGPGIPEDGREMVFVPFVKLDGRSTGVGLGLDIARQLARLHGGDIHLESVVGQGSTFTLELPVRAGG